MTQCSCLIYWQCKCSITHDLRYRKKKNVCRCRCNLYLFNINSLSYTQTGHIHHELHSISLLSIIYLKTRQFHKESQILFLWTQEMKTKTTLVCGGRWSHFLLWLEMLFTEISPYSNSMVKRSDGGLWWAGNGSGQTEMWLKIVSLGTSSDTNLLYGSRAVDPTEQKYCDYCLNSDQSHQKDPN